MIRRGQGDKDKVGSDALGADCESQLTTSQRDETVEKICSIELRSLMPSFSPRQKVSWARCRVKRSWESCPYTVIRLFPLHSGRSSMYDCCGCCSGTRTGDVVVRGTLRFLFGERKTKSRCDISFSVIREGLLHRESTSSGEKNGNSLSNGINGSVSLRMNQSAESRTSILNQRVRMLRTTLGTVPMHSPMENACTRDHLRG